MAREVRVPALALALACAQAGAVGAPAEYEVRYWHVLENKTAAPLRDVRVYLPIPPSDAFQEIRDFRIETGGRELPIGRRTDRYGTQIRRVVIPELAPGEEVGVGFACTVVLSPPPRFDLSARGGALEEIPPEIRERFTVDDPILGLATATVRERAQRFLEEHPDPVERALAIHDWIAGAFEYRSGDGWDHAPEVVERRSGSCSEFSYAFAALCRASGIPTRFAGGSIFPLRSEAPFVDRGWHRWVEAYLPRLGWVPFDATLDRAKPPKRDFAGSHHPRVLVLTRIGTRSQQLGLSYIGANSHTGETARKRTFTWSQGTAKLLAEALARLERGEEKRAKAKLTELAERFPGTSAGEEARRRLAELGARGR